MWPGRYVDAMLVCRLMFCLIADGCLLGLCLFLGKSLLGGVPGFSSACVTGWVGG